MLQNFRLCQQSVSTLEQMKGLEVRKLCLDTLYALKKRKKRCNMNGLWCVTCLKIFRTARCCAKF